MDGDTDEISIEGGKAYIAKNPISTEYQKSTTYLAGSYKCAVLHMEQNPDHNHT